MVSKSPVYFVDVCLPNEGEPDLSLEIGVLRWSANRDERPEVYIHGFLQPKHPARVRWANAEEMGITRDFITRQKGLPSISDIVAADFLKSRRVVCFNPSQEPWQSLVNNADTVVSIQELWAEIYHDDEKAMKCQRLSQMLEFLGLPTYDHDNHCYTPLLQHLHATAALWFLLEHFKEEPDNLKIREGFKFSTVWPLPPSKESWFTGNPKELSDIPSGEIDDFFSENLGDNLDWYNLIMYTHDWVFNRKGTVDLGDLPGQSEMAEFIFGKVFDLRMKLWVLIYYALYAHKNNYSKEIAHAGGVFSKVSPAIREDFTNFLLKHLQDFLSNKQKSLLIRGIIHQSMRERSKAPFENYDFDTLSREKREGEHPTLFFRHQSPHNCNVKCFWEIHNSNETVLFRRYEISGRGFERQACIDAVNVLLREFMQETRDPFSAYWTTPSVHSWIKFITGISWSEFSRAPKFAELPEISAGRHELASMIDEESFVYRKALQQNLVNIITAINGDEGRDETIKRFAFQGTSIEVKVTRKAQLPLLKRLLRMS